MTVPTADQPPAEADQTKGASARAGAPEPPKLRRRPMLIALSVLLIAIGALLGAWLLTGLSGTESYIAVRDGVERGDVIKESDLIRTELSADNAVSPLGWDEAQFVVGKRAATDMARGSLVTADSVRESLVPPADYTVVGLALLPGQSPSEGLQTGDPVRVITVSAGGEEQQESTPVSGKVANVRMSEDGSTKLVDVVVAERSAQGVAEAAARQQVSLVLDSSAKDSNS